MKIHYLLVAGFGLAMSGSVPGTMPSFTSGRPNVAWRAATARSHMASRPMPPAMQAPFTRAMSGTVLACARRKSCASGACGSE